MNVPATSAEDRIPLLSKFVYGLGALTNNLLSGAFGNMAIILNLGLGMDPTTVGSIMAASHLTDAFLDPFMGYLSDHTHSRWGRRRPYIVAGAILSGLLFALIWQVHAGHSQRFYFWTFLVGTILFYTAFSVFATPFVALGFELTPDYYERIRIQGFSNLIGQIPWLLLSWSYAFMQNRRLFDSSVQGARVLAVLIGATVVVFGVLPGIYCKEPFYAIARAAHGESGGAAEGLLPGLRRHLLEFLKGFGVTLSNKRFLKLAAATFLVFNGFTIIAGLGSYVIIFYVFGGDNVKGAQYVGWFGTTLSVCTFGAIAIVTWLGTLFGKKRAFIVATSIATAGYVLKWFCYRPGTPWLLFLPAPLLAFGLGGLFTTVSAMIADVCDVDELEAGRRREGTFGAIYWWMVKLGTAVALALSGYLLNRTGFAQSLGPAQTPRTLLLMRVFEIGVPVVMYLLAIFAIASYDLDPEKVQEVRVELEKRRGKTV
jgi:glycoside/pentoside/hexuronide:cation symporter, GPH family